MIDKVLRSVKGRIEELSLKPADAASQIGVTLQSLNRHLAGEYVRSDSLAKYRRWLDQKTNHIKQSISKAAQKRLNLDLKENSDPYTYGPERLCPSTDISHKPFKVVDLFCGCGGLSLGFERQGSGKSYNTVLGIDIEESMIRVFNDNHKIPSEGVSIGRIENLTDFFNETEILAYYLNHLVISGIAPELNSKLKDLGGVDLHQVTETLCQLDLEFIHQLRQYRSDPKYITTFKTLSKSALGQTSVIGFHEALRLPMTRLGEPKIGTLIWNDGCHDHHFSADRLTLLIDKDLIQKQRKLMNLKWNQERQRLLDRTNGKGTGQLSSSAKRITNFLKFLDTKSMITIKKLWENWQAKRVALRISVFDNKKVLSRLKELYRDGYKVDVLLGGPPCQGFSRIGRGKIRSLREQSVHVQQDDISVDRRNELLHQYVLFVSSLHPKVFLFENVRHFQAVVRTPEGSFDATEVLSEAIANISEEGLNYKVSSRIVKAQEHMIPQTRERYLMAGVRKDVDDTYPDLDLAKWCLSLPKFNPVSLDVALEGLPEPRIITHFANNLKGAVKIYPKQFVSDSTDPSSLYMRWIQGDGKISKTDSHIARSHRMDDSAFFALFAPGKRWMDYRCDNSTILNKMKRVFTAIKDKTDSSPELATGLGIDIDELNEVCEALDGSLSIRLLLETIPLPPGEIEHHLAKPTYLKKKEGNHGDWLARMDGLKPSKTIVSHMAKDSYAYIHPSIARTLSVREAARIQSFPDDYKFGTLGLVDGFRVIGNAVPALLSNQFANRILQVLITSVSMKGEIRQSEGEVKSKTEKVADHV